MASQLSDTVVSVKLLTAKLVGALHNCGMQSMLATQPPEFVVPSLTNRNVKQPFTVLEVKGPGIVFPQ